MRLTWPHLFKDVEQTTLQTFEDGLMSFEMGREIWRDIRNKKETINGATKYNPNTSFSVFSTFFSRGNFETILGIWWNLDTHNSTRILWELRK